MTQGIPGSEDEGYVKFRGQTWERMIDRTGNEVTWQSKGKRRMSLCGRYSHYPNHIELKMENGDRQLFDSLERQWRLRQEKLSAAGLRVEGTKPKRFVRFVIKPAKKEYSGRLLFRIDIGEKTRKLITEPEQLLRLADYIKALCDEYAD